jgi:hypothetical protein
MSNFGFVYILTNAHMPDVYKVGCTERSPHSRAEELSKPTGVPSPFKVLCYIEVDDFQTYERRMHEWLEEYRISSNREFFEGGLGLAVRLLYWLPTRLSFVEPRHARQCGMIERGDVYFPDEPEALDDTLDPWRRDDAASEGASAIASVVEAADQAIEAAKGA